MSQVSPPKQCMKPPGSATNAPRPDAAVATRSSTSGEGHHLRWWVSNGNPMGSAWVWNPKKQGDHRKNMGMKDGHRAKNGWCIGVHFIFASANDIWILGNHKNSKPQSTFFKQKGLATAFMIFMLQPTISAHFATLSIAMTRPHMSPPSAWQSLSTSLTKCLDNRSGADRRSPKLIVMPPGTTGVLHGRNLPARLRVLPRDLQYYVSWNIHKYIYIHTQQNVKYRYWTKIRQN